MAGRGRASRRSRCVFFSRLLYPCPLSLLSSGAAFEGPLDSTAVESLRSSWIPDLTSLSLHSPKPSTSSTSSPASPVPELNISPIDLTGGYHSRAKRTARFNEKKMQEKQHGKQVMKEVTKARRGRKAGAGEIELELP